MMKMRPLSEALIGKHNIDNASFSLKIGDDLQDWDIVVVGCECHTNEYGNDIDYGVYHKDFDNYVDGAIVYYGSRLNWNNMKDNYQWTYNKSFTHYVLAVYRPYPGKENTINPRRKSTDLKELENSKDYYCIYSNPVLLKKFKLK